MNYIEQLSTNEWKAKREEIILRDNSSCIECGLERSKLLGLSGKFGINDYYQLKSKNFSIIKNGKSEIAIIKNNFLSKCYFIGNEEQIPDVKELHFALQWTKPSNRFALKKSRYICFDKGTQTKKMYDLNVHHKYYMIGKMAWEYDNEALITLCASCHKKEHEKNKIPVYNDRKEFLHYAENCPKCDGSGVLSEYHYFMNGICFQCMGTGNINI